MVDKLDVILWDMRVGTLMSVPAKYGRESICFYFDPEFVKRGLDIFPLRASIDSPRVRSGMPIYPEKDKFFGGLPSCISDSLPDHWGNTVFAEWARVHGIRIKDLSPLDYLSYIGKRGMGALEFVPSAAKDMETPFKVAIDELHGFALKILDEAKNFNVELLPDIMVESLFRVGTSAGGKRAKAVVNVNFETGKCYSGQVPAPEPGFVPVIVKFDEHQELPMTRIEYSYYLIAREAGLNMMDSWLLEGEKETHFVTKRFDRNNDDKIHVLTLAAINPLSRSYEDMFTTAFRLGVPPAGLDQLFLSMVMNVLGANVDDHNKNFSFLMDSSGKWTVAPAYDYTFCIDKGNWLANKHSMSINGKVENIRRSDLLELAGRYDIRNASSSINKCISVLGSYGDFAQKAGIPANVIDFIQKEINGRIDMLE